MFFFISLFALTLASCGPKSGTGVDPQPQPQPKPTVGSYTLQSVTVSSQTLVCPAKSETLGVDCTNNKAVFDGKNYDLGAVISNPARTGTYTLSGNKIALSSGFGGTWTTTGQEATLFINELLGGSFSGSIRLPVTFKYIKN